MKKNFLTGLAILLPFVVTLWLMLFLLKLTTKPFTGAIEYILVQFDLVLPSLLTQYHLVIRLVSQVIVALLLTVFILFTGFAAQAMVVKYFIRIGNKILHKIPLINKIYKAVQDVMQTLFNEEKTFSQVALVPFPCSDTLCIGLITKPIDHLEDDAPISVFVPATPNPTIGFLLLFPKKQLVFIDLTVEDALKFVVSCGVVSPVFIQKTLLSKQEFSIKENGSELS